MSLSVWQQFWGKHCYLKGKILKNMLRQITHFICKADGGTPWSFSSRIAGSRGAPTAGGCNAAAVILYSLGKAVTSCHQLWRGNPWEMQTLRQRVTCWQCNEAIAVRLWKTGSLVPVCACGYHLLSGDLAVSPGVTAGHREAKAEMEPCPSSRILTRTEKALRQLLHWQCQVVLGSHCISSEYF